MLVKNKDTLRVFTLTGSIIGSNEMTAGPGYMEWSQIMVIMSRMASPIKYM